MEGITRGVSRPCKAPRLGGQLMAEETRLVCETEESRELGGNPNQNGQDRTSRLQVQEACARDVEHKLAM